MSYIAISRGLLVTGINAYSEAGHDRKVAFHKQGSAFLKKLAQRLNLNKDEYSIRSNEGGIAVSGEVTLHANHIYVQLAESCMRPGVDMLFRSCKGQKDCTGGRNNSVQLSHFRDEHTQERVLREMTDIIERERATA